MKKFSNFIKESIPLRIRTSEKPMYVLITGSDDVDIKSWYEKNLSGMAVVDGLLHEHHQKIEISFRTGNTLIHLAHGATQKSIEHSMRVAKARGMTTALVTFDDIECDNRLVDVKYKI